MILVFVLLFFPVVLQAQENQATIPTSHQLEYINVHDELERTNPDTDLREFQRKKTNVGRASMATGFQQQFGKLLLSQQGSVQGTKNLDEDKSFRKLNASLNGSRKSIRYNHSLSLSGVWTRGEDPVLLNTQEISDDLEKEVDNEKPTRYIAGSWSTQWIMSPLRNLSLNLSRSEYDDQEDAVDVNSANLQLTQVLSARSDLGMTVTRRQQKAKEAAVSLFWEAGISYNYKASLRNIWSFGLGYIESLQDQTINKTQSGQISFLHLFYRNKVLQASAKDTKKSKEDVPINSSADTMLNQLEQLTLNNAFRLTLGRGLYSNQDGSEYRVSNTANMTLDVQLSRRVSVNTQSNYVRNHETGSDKIASELTTVRTGIGYQFRSNLLTSSDQCGLSFQLSGERFDDHQAEQRFSRLFGLIGFFGKFL